MNHITTGASGIREYDLIDIKQNLESYFFYLHFIESEEQC